MSDRLYYTDAYLARFDARVVERLVWEGRPAARLDRTAFYPVSGGQPSDRGTMGPVPVVDVVEREDGEIVHVLDRPLDGEDRVQCEIDWPRRLDHMQQHTGQHLLSAALERARGISTLSFHLGSDASTIDVAAAVTLDELAPVEELANRVIHENRPVHVRFVDPAEAASLPLRKPPARQGTLRVIEIEALDVSACGGTHVARTGELGLLALTGAERYKGGTRLEFVCGGRAVARFQALRSSASSAARLLSTTAADLAASIERLQGELKQRRQEVRDWQERAITAEAERLLASSAGNRRVIARHFPDWEPQALKRLATMLAGHPGVVAVLVGSEPGTVVVACGTESGMDASAVVRELTSRFGGRGGGRAGMAQAGSLAASPSEILSAALAIA
ncbi:MAG TPA: DHHA1 domain-containing protein [Vicinamibacterales bacterium]|nr:DHHA1 domain-containing protein [Vicinamibacterales bacterium]